MGIALKRGPVLMACDGNYIRDAQAHFEQSRDTLVPTVVEVQVLDPEQRACFGKPAADRVWMVGEDAVRHLWHGADNSETLSAHLDGYVQPPP